MLRVVADHADRRALEIFAREIAPAGTSWSPGTTGPGSGRPAGVAADQAVRVPPRQGRGAGVVLDRRSAPEGRGLRVAAAASRRPATATEEPAAIEVEPRRPTRRCRCCVSPGRAAATRAISRTSAWSPAVPSGCRCSGSGSRRRESRRGSATSCTARSSASCCPASARSTSCCTRRSTAAARSRAASIRSAKGMAQLLLEMPIDVPRSIARELGEEA